MRREYSANGLMGDNNMNTGNYKDVISKEAANNKNDKSYIAFISYRHLPLDKKVAKYVQRSIEHYAVPKEYQHQVGGKRLGMVFRDEDELLSSPNLTESIKTALNHSKYLIIICTPDTPKSLWCEAEIQYFIKRKGRDHVLAVLVDGSPKESFPHDLMHIYDDNGNILEEVEPLAANITERKSSFMPFAFHKEIYRIYAAIIGCPFDDLWQREKRYRTLKLSALFGLIFVLITLFAFYNAVMLSKLSARQKQILQKDSENLLYISQTSMEQGKRIKALESVMESLPSDEEPDRPVIDGAEGLLSESLGIFSEEKLQVTNSISLPYPSERQIVSSDGKYLVVADNLCVLRCFNTRTGEELWNTSLEYYNTFPIPIIEMLEDINAVLFISEHQIDVYSLKTGETLWMRQLDCNFYEKKGKELLVLSNNYENCSFYFIDIETGKDVRKEQPILQKTDVEDYASNGVFNSTGEYFFCTYQRENDTNIYIDWINTQTGESDKTSVVPGSDKILHNNYYYDLTMYYYPHNQNASGEAGILICLTSEYEQNHFSLHTGFLKEKDAEWDFFTSIEFDPYFYEIDGAADRSPRAMPTSNGYLIFFAKQLVVINQKGIVTEHFDQLNKQYICDDGLPEGNYEYYAKLSYCRYQMDPFAALLVYEDGSADYITKKAVKHFAITDKKLQLVESSGKTMKNYQYGDFEETDFTLSGEDIKSPLCMLLSQDNRNVYIAEWIGNKEASYAAEQELGVKSDLYVKNGCDYTGNCLYILPDEKSVLSLYYSEQSEGDPNITAEGAIYNLYDMSEKYRFSFQLPLESMDLIGTGTEGKNLVFQDYIYDLESQKLNPIDGESRKSIYHDLNYNKPQFIYKKRVSGEEDIDIYTAGIQNILTEQSVHWFYKGSEYVIPLTYDGNFIPDNRAVYAFASRNGYHDEDEVTINDIITGNNGLMILKCSNPEDISVSDFTGTKRLTHLMVYSLDTQNWTKVPIPSSLHAEAEEPPLIIPSEKKKRIAIVGTDSILRIYDLEKDDFLLEKEDMIPYTDVNNMTFIEDDQYLLVWQKYFFSVLDTNTGTVVFQKRLKEGLLSGTCYKQDNLLYIPGREGFCIDTINWKEIYDIPYLAAATKDWIVTQNMDYIIRFPKYSFQDQIEIGNGDRCGLPR